MKFSKQTKWLGLGAFVASLLLGASFAQGSTDVKVSVSLGSDSTLIDPGMKTQIVATPVVENTTVTSVELLLGAQVLATDKDAPFAFTLTLSGPATFTARVNTASGQTAVSAPLAFTINPNPKVRIMMLGDSITGSPGCWRSILWNHLQEAGYTNIDFVGTRMQKCPQAHDQDNEGHGGYRVVNVATDGSMQEWLPSTKPDVVVMHFGTNDIWRNTSNKDVLGAYTSILAQIRKVNPNVILLVSQIIPIAPEACPDCPARTISFNKEIPDWATANSTATSPIYVVDQWTGWDSATMTGDGVHPNEEGILKFESALFHVLIEALPPRAKP